MFLLIANSQLPRFQGVLCMSLSCDVYAKATDVPILSSIV